MSIFVSSCTIDQIFSKKPFESENRNEKKEFNGTITIPEYQRPYCWSAQQITKLLVDYNHHQNKLLTQQDQPKIPFYLGSIILHQADTKLNIIDGQQRITTLALIAYIKEMYIDFQLEFKSPQSHKNIYENLKWLKTLSNEIKNFNFSDLNVTVVITDNEDEAYRFFETQNTGGVRLSGPDIIKAHHLRSIAIKNRELVNNYASKWESLGDLNPVVDLILRGRYWQILNFREYPSHNETKAIRDSIVDELAEFTEEGEDVGYGKHYKVLQKENGKSMEHNEIGYQLRQPLNSGVNTIHFLQYFENIRKLYLDNTNNQIDNPYFFDFYNKLITKLEGCNYLKQLFDASILVYISQHGPQQLDILSKKLFRVVYAPRITNRVAVREKSIPAFLTNAPVLDWLCASYTPAQCFSWLDQYTLTINIEGLNKNSIKKRFIEKVSEYFDFKLIDESYAQDFEIAFNNHIKSLGN